ASATSTATTRAPSSTNALTSCRKNSPSRLNGPSEPFTDSANDSSHCCPGPVATNTWCSTSTSPAQTTAAHRRATTAGQVERCSGLGGAAFDRVGSTVVIPHGNPVGAGTRQAPGRECQQSHSPAPPPAPCR